MPTTPQQHPPDDEICFSSDGTLCIPVGLQLSSILEALAGHLDVLLQRLRSEIARAQLAPTDYTSAGVRMAWRDVALLGVASKLYLYDYSGEPVEIEADGTTFPVSFPKLGDQEQLALEVIDRLISLAPCDCDIDLASIDGDGRHNFFALEFGSLQAMAGEDVKSLCDCLNLLQDEVVQQARYWQQIEELNHTPETGDVQKLSPCYLNAARSYLDALKELGDRIKDLPPSKEHYIQVHAHLKSHGHEVYTSGSERRSTLPAFDTWLRYVRKFIQTTSAPSNTPRAGRPTGKSIIRREDTA